MNRKTHWTMQLYKTRTRGNGTFLLINLARRPFNKTLSNVLLASRKAQNTPAEMAVWPVYVSTVICITYCQDSKTEMSVNDKAVTIDYFVD